MVLPGAGVPAAVGGILNGGIGDPRPKVVILADLTAIAAAFA